MANIRVTGSGLIKLTGNFGFNTSTVKGLAAGTTIDATGASWIVANSANQHPDANTSFLVGSGTINTYAFIVYGAGAGLTLRGGTVWGQVPQTSDWVYTYNNSAAVRIEYAPGITIDSWRIDKAWDAIRIQGGSDNFLINDVHLSNIRDDGVENDLIMSGTVRDSLFDGVFAGISLGNSQHADGSDNVIRLEHTFIRMQSYLVNGEVTHGSPFKTDTSAPGHTPDIRIINSVIAIDDPTHNGLARLKLAWENVVESHGNVFLNLSDTPLPSNYPKPPAGFVILQGQQARDYWEACKAAWMDNHDGTPVSALTPLPPLPGTSSSTNPIPAGTNFVTGTKADDLISGTGGIDQIDGRAGADFIYGKGGSDILMGKLGRDKFVFDTALDGSVDTLADFNPAHDSIYLDNAIFGKLGAGSLASPGKLDSGWLVDGPGAVARDADDYILYDKTTGALSYDADGSGSGAAVKFAQLPTGLDLASTHFFVI